MAQTPVARGLLLCEKVIVEEGTHNHTLVSSFATLRFEAFPVRSLRFIAYTVLTDGDGDFHLRLTVVRLDDLREIHAQAFRARFPDRLRAYRVRLPVRDVVLPSPGLYLVSLDAEGETIAQTVFSAVL